MYAYIFPNALFKETQFKTDGNEKYHTYFFCEEVTKLA